MQSAIVFINGFRQGIGPGEGLRGLYLQAARTWFDRRRDLVLHRMWDSDHRETADLILQHEPKAIHVIGYSYGCGWGVTRLADELDRRARCINTAFLVDPVKRYRVLKPAALGWMGRNWLRYTIPRNVLRAYSWRQVNGAGPLHPVGHRIRKISRDTDVHPQIVYGSEPNLDKYAAEQKHEWRINPVIDHNNIDEAQHVHAEILETLTQLSPPPEDVQP